MVLTTPGSLNDISKVPNAIYEILSITYLGLVLHYWKTKPISKSILLDHYAFSPLFLLQQEPNFQYRTRLMLCACANRRE